MTDSENIVAADRNCMWHPFTQMRDWQESEPLVIESGDGAMLRDVDGNEYIDGVSSLWANVHGHRHPTIDRYVRDQLDKMAHSTLLGLAHAPSARLAERLVDITPEKLKRVFFSDNGSTAAEIAIKIAYQYWQQCRNAKPEKTRLVSFTNSYHGDTLGAVGTGGIHLFHAVYAPLITPSIQAYYPYCYRCKYGMEPSSCTMHCTESIERTLEDHADEVFAVIIEPLVQGAGGMIKAPPGFLKKVRELSHKHNVLMITDEVATGFGRTGKMFACEHEDVTPDLMAIGKGLTGGYLPAAATMVTDEIYSAFLGDYADQKTFFHGHTYTGNPLACAAGLGSLDVFDQENTIDQMQPKIELLEELLEPIKELDHVGEIRQNGFMVGIELVKNKSTREEYPWEEQIGVKVAMDTRNEGVILRPLGNVIVLMPPLSITTDQLDILVNVTAKSIQNITV